MKAPNNLLIALRHSCRQIQATGGTADVHPIIATADAVVVVAAADVAVVVVAAAINLTPRSFRIRFFIYLYVS